MDDARKWFQAQPFCTKWLLALSALIPLASKLGVLPIFFLVYNNTLIVKKVQIWRLFTAPFLTMPSLGFLLGLIMRYQYSVALETERFLGRSVDYFWFLFLMILGIGSLNAMVNVPTLWDAFSMAIVYLWSKDNAQVIVRYMFGLQFKVHLFLCLLIGILLAGSDDGLFTDYWREHCGRRFGNSGCSFVLFLGQL